MESKLQLGTIVQTSYNTGPYRIINISRDCDCPSFHDEINCPMDKAPRSEIHTHLVVVDKDTPTKTKYPEKDLYWLNGYREYPDGTIKNVWHDNDQLNILGFQGGEQPGLF